jgi:hypothetical protein
MKMYITLLQDNKISALYNEYFFDEQIEINLEEEDIQYLERNIAAAYYENKKIIYKNLDKIKLKESLQLQKETILNWFLENDWKVNKVVIGEWEKTDERWLEYFNERQIKRTRLDQIEFELSMLG